MSSFDSRLGFIWLVFDIMNSYTAATSDIDVTVFRAQAQNIRTFLVSCNFEILKSKVYILDVFPTPQAQSSPDFFLIFMV